MCQLSVCSLSKLTTLCVCVCERACKCSFRFLFVCGYSVCRCAVKCSILCVRLPLVTSYLNIKGCSHLTLSCLPASALCRPDISSLCVCEDVCIDPAVCLFLRRFFSLVHIAHAHTNRELSLVQLFVQLS